VIDMVSISQISFQLEDIPFPAASSSNETTSSPAHERLLNYGQSLFVSIVIDRVVLFTDCICHND
jgi:hypothetical protein